MNTKKIVALILSLVLALSVAIPVFATNRDNEVDFEKDLEGVTDPVVYGDVDGNGEVDNLDLVLLLKYTTDNTVEINEENANVDGVGAVDNLDLVLLLKYTTDNSVPLGPQA